MATNYYDQPAQAAFMNTYVPIDFGELHRIGTTQHQAIQAASKNLQGNLQSWAEFTSPSAADTQSFYELTTDRFTDIVNEMAANPDLMKDAGYRARLQSMINNVDYGTLAQLRQSREGLLQRQAANQQLMMSGRYNPEWHDIDFNAYDTRTQGIFNETSPLAYKSIVDLVSPFLNDLKPSFIQNRGGYEYRGVTEERVMDQVDQYLSSIEGTPEFQKHVQTYVNRGLDYDDAVTQVENEVYRAAKEFVWEDRSVDPLYLKQMELAAKQAAKSPTQLNNLTTMLYRDSAIKLGSNFSGLDPATVDAIFDGATVSAEARAQFEYGMQPENIRQSLRQTFEQNLTPGRGVTNATDAVLDRLTSTITSTTNDLLARDGTSGERVGAGGNLYRGHDSTNFVLADDFVFSILGDGASDKADVYSNLYEQGKIGQNTSPEKIKSHVKAMRDFEKAWKNGAINNFLVMGDTKTITDGGQLYHQKTILVPMDVLAKAGLERVVGRTVKLGSDETSTSLRSDINEVRHLLRENEIEVKEKGVSTTTKDKTTEYYVVKALRPIESRGEAAITRDSQYTKKTRGLSAGQTDIQAEISEYERF